MSQSLLNTYVKGDIKIQNFDNGSLWIDIFLGSLTAVTFLASLAWAAAVVRKKIYEGDIILEKVKGLKVKNESISDLEQANKKQLELLIEGEAKNLVKDIEGARDDNEYIERLKHSIKLLAELINKRTEIHPALEAPEEVKNLLPDFTKLDFIESKTKLLSEHN